MSYSEYSLGFYKGRGTIVDKTIRAVTRSRYSHVELIRHYGTTQCEAISASARDGGVRVAEIDFDSGNWDIIHLQNWVLSDAWGRAACRIGARYDYKGVLFNQFLSLRSQNNCRWFCSELCAHALGINGAARLAPGDLYYMARALNAAFMAGRHEGKYIHPT